MVDSPAQPLDLSYINSSQNSLEVHKQKDVKDHSGQPVDAILLAYMMIFETVLNSHESAQLVSKQVENNGNVQNKLINAEQAFNFTAITTGKLKMQPNANGVIVVSANGPDVSQFADMVMNRLQDHNEEISSIRNTFEDKLNVAKQTAQVGETNLNTILNESGTSIQAGGSIMQMLVSLTNQVARI